MSLKLFNNQEARRVVLKGICLGKTNEELARDFGVPIYTIKVIVGYWKKKYNAKNRANLAYLAAFDPPTITNTKQGWLHDHFVVSIPILNKVIDPKIQKGLTEEIEKMVRELLRRNI